jgi:sulfite reductase beta subunit-like hemoprotein
LDPLFEEYAANSNQDEHFGDYFVRTRQQQQTEVQQHD